MSRYVEAMIAILDHPELSAEVRHEIAAKLDWFPMQPPAPEPTSLSGNTPQVRLLEYLNARIRAVLDDPDRLRKKRKRLELPPGSPIGG